MPKSLSNEGAILTLAVSLKLTTFGKAAPNFLRESRSWRPGGRFGWSSTSAALQKVIDDLSY